MAKASKAEREISRLRQRAKSAKMAIDEEAKGKGFLDRLRRAIPGGAFGTEEDVVRFEVDKKGSAKEQRKALKKGLGAIAEATKERTKRVTGIPMVDVALGDIRLARQALKDDKPARQRTPKPKPKPTAAAAKTKAPAKAAKPGPKGDMMGVYSRALAKGKAQAKEPAKDKAKAAPSSKPKLPKNWKSLPTDHPDRVAYRNWLKSKVKKSVKPKAKAVPIKVGKPSTKATPKRTADLTGLQKRIEMKRKSGQAIPKAWLKAEKAAKAKASAAKKAERLSVTKENLAEVQRGRKEMSERKARVSADASRRRAQRLAQLDPLVKARQKAEVARGKTEAQERVARMRKDSAERSKRKQMQATMSALPGFRR